ncbi:Uncharacterised protein [Citrobacter freundii]|nr:hypothetical protein [Citrobacter freundii]WOY57214.1 hypothetical protein R6I13_11590 [Citrobacter freundii]WOY57798.1 hypothetical protein R6I17_13740 [Citrobacter freundii]WPZ50480.1 hypothetical protein R6I57_11590 [Citrobacter freundii]VDZ59942.1 Uncharacterised protein [Citrobacter freundii]GAL39891.1 hypothetical protein CIFRE_12_02430 [Citrobacter freundii ATCC 8090 = MTCC 1658 = NBRC 12681]
MWGRNIKWCVGIILAVALTIAVTMTLQNWQRSHFDCSGELVMEYPDIRGDISVRYVFNGSNGVAILRGKITDNNGEKLAVNQNVWFTFTRKDDDYFMESGNVASSSGGTNIHPLLARTLPDFFLKPKEPFYFSILRLNSST